MRATSTRPVVFKRRSAIRTPYDTFPESCVHASYLANTTPAEARYASGSTSMAAGNTARA